MHIEHMTQSGSMTFPFPICHIQGHSIIEQSYSAKAQGFGLCKMFKIIASKELEQSLFLSYQLGHGLKLKCLQGV